MVVVVVVVVVVVQRTATKTYHWTKYTMFRMFVILIVADIIMILLFWRGSRRLDNLYIVYTVYNKMFQPTTYCPF